jgi:S-adenosylmethionine hydrolase
VRKSVVLKTKTGLYFVSPDNGSLSGPAEAYGIEAVREIDEAVNRIPGSEWSHTFHGRDVYSYTGARLAAGVISFEQVGPELSAEVIRLKVTSGSFDDGILTGYVAGGTGRLGNIFFNIDRALFAQTDAEYGDQFSLEIHHNNKVVWHGTLPYVRAFGSVPEGSNLLFMNSSGALSAAINQGNFANTHNILSGIDWTVRVQQK